MTSGESRACVKKPVRQVNDPNPNGNQLIAAKRWEDAYDYIYPRILSLPNRYDDKREYILWLINEMVRLLYDAGKSNQISKVRIADGHLATIRWHLKKLYGLSGVKLGESAPVQFERLIGQVGGILNSWGASLTEKKDGKKPEEQR